MVAQCLQEEIDAAEEIEESVQKQIRDKEQTKQASRVPIPFQNSNVLSEQTIKRRCENTVCEKELTNLRMRRHEIQICCYRRFGHQYFDTENTDLKNDIAHTSKTRAKKTHTVLLTNRPPLPFISIRPAGL